MDYRKGLHLIPPHMHHGVALYIDSGLMTGDFLTCIMENDFVHAIGRADQMNRDAILQWAEFLYNYAPSPCWGSRAKVTAWQDHNGLKGAT